MASTARISAPPLPAVQRYFEVSLFLLVSTGILAVISTGKLDPVSAAIPPIALAYKFIRVWHGRGPELSARLATGLVLAYFLFLPVDLWVISRGLATGAPNPTLYAALLAAIHLLLFATLVRLFSARTNRDFAFLAMLAVTCMLASAFLTAETTFLVRLAVFFGAGGFHVGGAGNSPGGGQRRFPTARARFADGAPVESSARSDVRAGRN